MIFTRLQNVIHHSRQANIKTLFQKDIQHGQYLLDKKCNLFSKKKNNLTIFTDLLNFSLMLFQKMKKGNNTNQVTSRNVLT